MTDSDQPEHAPDIDTEDVAQGQRVTIDDVRRAIDELNLGPPKFGSADRIRRHLGFGSCTTIQKHLNTIRRERAPKPEIPAPVKPPVEALTMLWNIATTAADLDLAKRLEAVSKERDAAVGQSEVDAADALAAWEESDRQRVRADSAEARAAAADSAARDSGIALTALKEREQELLARHEEQAAKVGVLKEETSRLREELIRLQQESLAQLIKE